MTISESARLSILELSSQGMSIREIVADTGVSKSTVERIVKTAKKEDSVLKIPAHAHTRVTKEVSSKLSSKNEDTCKPVVTVVEARTITRDLTISELFDLLQSAKEDLAIARRNNDGSKDAIMAVSASTKVVTDILKQMGKWCGLDDSIKVVDVKADKSPDQYTLDEALRLAEDLCRRRGSSARVSPSRSG